MSKNYWIDLNDRKKENTFAWTDLTTQTGERTSQTISKMKIVWSLIKKLWDTYSMTTLQVYKIITIRLQNEKYVFDTPKLLFTTQLTVFDMGRQM